MRTVKSVLVASTIFFGGCVTSDVKLMNNYHKSMSDFKTASDNLQNNLQILLYAAQLNIDNRAMLSSCLAACLEITEMPTDLEQGFAEGMDLHDVEIMRAYNKRLLAEAKDAEGNIIKARAKLALNYEKHRDSAVVSHGVMKMILIAGSFIGLALLAKFFFRV